jgi:hypothetical protein
MNFKIEIKDTITARNKVKQKELAKVPADAFIFFRAHTPVRTGNARRNTFLSKNTIVGAYPYAQRLDDGYSSQAPDGMSKPTEAYIKKRLDAILGKK